MKLLDCPFPELLGEQSETFWRSGVIYVPGRKCKAIDLWESERLAWEGLNVARSAYPDLTFREPYQQTLLDALAEARSLGLKQVGLYQSDNTVRWFPV